MADVDHSDGPGPSIFDMDPNDTVDADALPALLQSPAQPDAPASDAQGTEEDAPLLEKPQDLPPELEARWEEERKKHQRTYSKAQARLREREKSIATYRQKAELVDRFYSDPTYAAQTMQQMAQQLGYTLTRANGQPAQQSQQGQQAHSQGQATQGGGQIPDWVNRMASEAVTDNPDLAFLAPIIAKAAWSITNAATEPLQQEAEARRKADEDRRTQDRQAEFERLALELEEQGVDWREHEEEMTERLNFLRAALTNQGSWSHPRYGNVLQLLHTWVAGPKAAQAEAGRRLQQAMQNRTSTGTATRSPGVNTQQLIRDAKTQQEQFAIAFRAALAEAGSQLRR